MKDGYSEYRPTECGWAAVRTEAERLSFESFSRMRAAEENEKDRVEKERRKAVWRKCNRAAAALEDAAEEIRNAGKLYLKPLGKYIPRMVRENRVLRMHAKAEKKELKHDPIQKWLRRKGLVKLPRVKDIMQEALKEVRKSYALSEDNEEVYRFKVTDNELVGLADEFDLGL